MIFPAHLLKKSKQRGQTLCDLNGDLVALQQVVTNVSHVTLYHSTDSTPRGLSVQSANFIVREHNWVEVIACCETMFFYG